MNTISRRFSETEGIFEDYATTPVPEGKRFSWLSQGIVWSGGSFCLTMFSIGGMLASSMNFTSFVITILLGSSILTLISSLIGSIGARTHMASAFNSRFTLGVKGGKIFGLILAVSLFGWFGYQCHYLADDIISTLKIFGFFGSSPALWVIIGGIFMMITAIVGLSGITLLSSLGVPLLYSLVLVAACITARHVDFSVLQTSSAQALGGMSLSGGVVIVVGSFISGACIVSDLSRFSKKPRDAVRGCLLGFMISFTILLLLGGFFYYAYGTSNLCNIFITHCHLGIFVPFILIISTWTTNDYNLYCSVLGISNALNDHMKLPRWLLTLTVGIASIMLGALGIMEAFPSFLNLLGVLIPPVAAVIIADYYFYNRNSGLYVYENTDKLKDFRGNTCFSAIMGILSGLLCTYGNISFLNTLCSVVPSCIVAMLVSIITLVVYNLIGRCGRVEI